MRRGSVVGPLILIAIGALFLMNNLRPDLSVAGILARYWPFVLIAWGGLRLLEILFWAVVRKPLPVSGISGGEWVLVVFLSLLGSGMFFVHQRSNWPPFPIRMRGLEVFGEAYDYPIPERTVTAAKAARVVVENMRGNARINGTDANEVKVTGRKTIRAMSREAADATERKLQFEVVSEGDTVYIRAGRSGLDHDEFVVSDLEIKVPRGARIECRGRKGDFDVTGVAGDVEVASDNAGVRLEMIGGKVRIETRASDIIRASGVKGTVEIKGYGHDVELENIEGQVTVSGNYFGDLQFRNIPKPVRFEGGIRNRTTDVRVEGCPGQIRMERGNLIMEQVTGPVVVTAKSKDVQISDFTQALELKLDRGDVEIRAGRMPVPKMDVATDSGNIDLTLPENAHFKLKGTARRGEVENEFGSALTTATEGRGGTIIGAVGEGAAITLLADHGSVRVRKGSQADLARPLMPPPPKSLKLPAEAPLVVERN